MFTNQAVDLDEPRPPELRCHHAPGEAADDTCAYLHTLWRLREWVDRAAAAHAAGEGERPRIGGLTVLYGEVAGAFDRCPNNRALPQPARADRRPAPADALPSAGAQNADALEPGVGTGDFTRTPITEAE